MFGIDGPEFLLIAVVAVLAIGPSDIPRALYNFGRFIRKFKILTADIQKSLDHIMEQGELEEITREANKPGAENIQFEVERQLMVEQKNKKTDATK